MNKNVYQILQDWHELLKSGVITEEEFAAKKKELLGGDKRTSKNSNQEDIHIRTLEEQAQYDAEYELLFNNKSWFHKNKGWLIGLGIAIITGILIWYLSSEKSNANSESDIYSQSKISEVDKIQAGKNDNLSNVENLIGYWFVPHNAMINIKFNRDGKFEFNDYNAILEKDELLKGTYKLENGILTLLYEDRPKQEFEFYKSEHGDDNYYIKKKGYYFVKGENGDDNKN